MVQRCDGGGLVYMGEMEEGKAIIGALELAAWETMVRCAVWVCLTMDDGSSSFQHAWVYCGGWLDG